MHMAVLNCGVAHTGQFHQLSKMKEIVGSKPPKYIVVGFFENDLANDYFFPHSRIVEGFMVDDVSVVDGAVKRQSDAELRSAFEAMMRAATAKPPAAPFDRI